MVLHTGYSSPEIVEKKQIRNMEILKGQLKENENNPVTIYLYAGNLFDLDRFAKFIKQTNTFGVPVIAEVMILRTAGMARFLNRHLKPGLVPNRIIQKLDRTPDKQKASIEIFTDLVSGLKDLCQGIHIITIGAEAKLKNYLDAAKFK